ncbi:HAD-IIIC family phosphatase [Gluconobacter cerinus]|uniref:Uncharacterized protein n=1 Tax=Gluconobacter cerinus TaxID=38307 RepID=A0AAV5NAI1_9PROT|nr:HAD-IIIC family phosphatase [Gluconobacter cerinus]GBR03045.1 HAD family phosphatase [Gluconobacter cerinus NRIC 0229]GLQ61529.1 hypothetical protein GCM10007867_03740 [Gluconobacter cerinus]
MTEPVRLVIWDLDETFWPGTLTEGGINEAEHLGHVVRALAERGIISSICSKNDFEETKSVLERLGVWDLFVFPSISWEPKGPRVAHIVEQAKLRAPTIMFIDDNPMNLAEVSGAVPGIQVSDEKLAPFLLDNPLFVGKADPEMKRLHDYKLLEVKSEAKASAGDTWQFLRESRITVEICYDLEANRDRAIELINRTNQLNFTKKRLSENIDEARNQFDEIVNSGIFHHSGLVRVRDKYGDYGFVGFFHQTKHSQENILHHFCFSCRTLGMYVETWLYRQLECPSIEVVGDVLTNLFDETNPVDWISYYREEVEEGAEVHDYPKLPIQICGGCDMDSVQHYLAPATDDFRLFTNTVRQQTEIRRDHSSMIRRSIEGSTEEEWKILSEIGFIDADFDTKLKDIKSGFLIFSFWADIYYSDYEIVGCKGHTTFAMNPFNYQNLDNEYEGILRHQGRSKGEIEQFRAAKANLKYSGKMNEGTFKDNLNYIFSNISTDVDIILINSTTKFHETNPEWGLMDRHLKLNKYQREISNNYDNVSVVEMDDFILSSSDIVSSTHFTRSTYQRLGTALKKRAVTGMQDRDKNIEYLKRRISELQAENDRLKSGAVV